MNIDDLGKLDKNSFPEEFRKLKELINIEMNHFDSIESAKTKIDYIALELFSNNPDEIEILSYLDELSNIVGIQAYINDYKFIIERHFENL